MTTDLSALSARQRDRMATGQGFIAALDQSGGSTPKALAAYGITDDAWQTDAEMFDLVHQMRSRLMTSPAFDRRILGAILFENTMDRHVAGQATAEYLWQTKGIVPFVKCDAGLAESADGVQLMKPIPRLDDLLTRARAKGVYGTKMRSVIHGADAHGVARVIAQQFEIGRQIIDAGLMPIIEPEVSIDSPEKAAAEQLTLDAIEAELATLGDAEVMLKLTLPETAGHYRPLVDHPNVLRVVALSGGYSLDASCARLADNLGIIASFSRVLTHGLSADQDQGDFDTTLHATIEKIYEASLT